MSTIAITHNTNIDALLSLSSWASATATPISLTYSFMTAYPSNASVADKNGWLAMSQVQQQAVASALAQWATVANVTFSQIADGGFSGGGGSLRFATNLQNAATFSAYGPTGGTSQGNVYLDNGTIANATPSAGTAGYVALMQAVGTALGLKNPDNTGGAVAPYLATSVDTKDYSLLAQGAAVSTATSGLSPSAPMLYDIQALQYMYGANNSYHSGNDTYSFATNNAPVCIWDAGGFNTFDFSRCSGPYVINLNAGSFSSTNTNGTGTALNNVSIAFGVSIQNAIGGSGGGTITCSNAANTVTGGSGNDVIVIGTGTDIINGGGGSDTVQLTFAAHDISGDSITRVQTLDMNGQAATMKIAQFNAFASFINTSGGVVFTDNGLIAANPQVTKYSLANGVNTFNVISPFQPTTSITGGSGNDTVTVPGSVINDNWAIDGGGGTNTVHITGNYAVTLGQLNQITNTQAIIFDNTTTNVTFNAGLQMSLGAPTTLAIDTTAQTTGSTVINAGLLHAISLNVALGGTGNATVNGGSANDTVNGNGGLDTITTGGGVDTLRAGSGINLLMLSGASGQYTVAQSGVAMTVADGVGNRDGQATLTGNSIMQFTDKTLYSLNAADAAIAKLYVAAFGRLPDAGGLTAWGQQYATYVPAAHSGDLITALAVDQVANHASIAYDFTHSTEFINTYGSLSDAQFVTQLYANVLGRSPDSQGYASWTAALAAGTSREQTLVGFAISNEDAAHTSGWLFAF